MQAAMQAHQEAMIAHYVAPPPPPPLFATLLLLQRWLRRTRAAMQLFQRRLLTALYVDRRLLASLRDGQLNSIDDLYT